MRPGANKQLALGDGIAYLTVVQIFDVERSYSFRIIEMVSYDVCHLTVVLIDALSVPSDMRNQENLHVRLMQDVGDETDNFLPERMLQGHTAHDVVADVQSDNLMVGQTGRQLTGLCRKDEGRVREKAKALQT